MISLTDGDKEAGQRIRYSVIPRTLTFLIHGNQVLLLRLANDRGEWGGKLNGVGGHVEKAEDPLSAAFREVKEETGITPPSLSLCGLVHIDIGKNPGISLYIYVGKTTTLEIPIQTSEGTAEWQAIASLQDLPVVEDLLILLPKALEAYDTKKSFSASYQFTKEGEISITYQND